MNWAGCDWKANIRYHQFVLFIVLFSICVDCRQVNQSPSNCRTSYTNILFVTKYCISDMEGEPMETSDSASTGDKLKSEISAQSASSEACKVEDVQMEEATVVVDSVTSMTPPENAETKQPTNVEEQAAERIKEENSSSSHIQTSSLPVPETESNISEQKAESDDNSVISGSQKVDVASDSPGESSPSKADVSNSENETKSPDNKKARENAELTPEKQPQVVAVKGTGKEPSLKKADSEAMRVLDKDESKTKGGFNIGKLEEEEQREIPVFPKTLEEFGFKFNEKGELRSNDKDEPFEFSVKEDDHFYNQKRYEALGELITDHVYKLMEDVGLEKVYLPVNAQDWEPRSFFFMSPGAFEKESLMILIHGSGVVRAGQWTRKLIINNDLDKGTQLPYIRFGLEQGYGVIVLNTNLNRAIATIENKQTEQPIECSRFPETHAFYIWDNFIAESAVKHIAVVAHSYGGVVASYLAEERMKEFHKRVFAIAFTDSVHSLQMIDASKRTHMFFADYAVNWVSSDLPRDTVLPHQSRKPDARRISAGHEKHEWTSYAAMESVFHFIKERHRHRLQNPNGDSFCTNL